MQREESMPCYEEHRTTPFSAQILVLPSALSHLFAQVCLIFPWEWALRQALLTAPLLQASCIALGFPLTKYTLGYDLTVGWPNDILVTVKVFVEDGVATILLGSRDSEAATFHRTTPAGETVVTPSRPCNGAHLPHIHLNLNNSTILRCLWVPL